MEILKSPRLIVVHREDITNHYFQEVFTIEAHVRHQIVKPENSNILYWEKSLVFEDNEKKGGSTLDELIVELVRQGHDKNSEIYRQLYRDSGCSLFEYYETFYVPNDSHYPSEYVPGKK